MGEVIDAKGMACPQPVLMTKKALTEIEEGVFTVLVDSAISRDNVVRFATSQGCETRVEERDGVFHIEVVKGDRGDMSEDAGEATPASNITIYVHSDRMGQGDDRLGRHSHQGVPEDPEGC